VSERYRGAWWRRKADSGPTILLLAIVLAAINIAFAAADGDSILPAIGGTLIGLGLVVGVFRFVAARRPGNESRRNVLRVLMGVALAANVMLFVWLLTYS
jgi:hypothetical protein